MPKIAHCFNKANQNVQKLACPQLHHKRILPGNQHLKPILVQVAWIAVKQRNTPFHKWFWSHQGKLGKKKAIVAVARKILSLIYKLLADDVPYDNEVAISNLKK